MADTISTRLMSAPKWGRLIPIRFVRDRWTAGHKRSQRRPVWLFQCDCGATKEICAYSVSSGRTESCGCLRVEMGAGASHGEARGRKLSPEYRAWRNMLTRSKNPNISHAHRYSGRGIGICAEWDSGGDGKGFDRFLGCIGRKPSPAHTLDRIDNDRPYEPGNVRWAGAVQQARNTSRTIYVRYLGEVLPVQDAAEKSGIKAAVIRDRIRLGWPEDKLFSPRARAPFGLGKKSRPGVKPRN